MLKFIGNGSAFSKTGNTSAYYKTEEGNMLLIDCGESVFQELLKKNILDGVKNILVLITHAHSDHCGSLSGLIWYCEYILKCEVYVVAPDAVLTILELMGNHKKSYRRLTAKDLEPSGYGSFQFTPVKVQHQDGMDCFGYIVSVDATMEIYNFYYTGDTKKFDRKLIDALLKNQLNDIYCDVTEYDGDDNVHMNIDKLATLVPEKLRPFVYLMHFADNFPKSKAIELGFKITEVE
jgi:ribonuclease BN (tRNA processing enzyme)